MVEFTPTSFSTGKHLLTEQTAEGRKKATSCVCQTGQRITFNTGIKLKPLLLKPFNSLPPLPASHLKHVFLPTLSSRRTPQLGSSPRLLS